MNARSRSPIERALEENAFQLPETFQIQFFHRPADTQPVKIEGMLSRVWFRPSWLFPLFFLLERCGILVCQCGRNIPTTLQVTSEFDRKGAAIQQWERRFHGSRPAAFDVSVIYDEVTERPVDLVGPGRFLALAWDIEFEAPNEIRIDVCRAGIRLGNRFAWFPAFLWPYLLGRETFRQKLCSDLTQEFEISLGIEHPIFGPVFGYEGRFAIKSPTVHSSPGAGA